MGSVVPLRKRHIVHRGDHMPNIVQTMQLGNTTVMVADTFFPKTEAERQKVQENITETMWTWWESMTVEEQIAFNESLEREKSAV